MSNYDDIRPYNDDEASAVLRRVIADSEFIDLVGALRFPHWYTRLRWLLRPLARNHFMRKTRNVRSIEEVQLLVEQYMERMLAHTTSEFAVVGLDKLNLATPHLFISNHRDITLDPAFTNYAIHHEGGATVRIAIGDNLLSKPYASDLMRLNKSFIVRRSISKPRELLAALKKLSRYIWHSLHVDHENVWLAQREGRAKNGMDRTEPAIIKMLAIARPKELDFAAYINSLRIVPLSISYELDPCDALKARELRQISENRAYEKAEHEDLASIGIGISGQKGRVSLVFGDVLQTAADNADTVAQQLDQQIVRNYQLQRTNIIAYRRLYGNEAWARARAALLACETHHDLPEVSEASEQSFAERIAAMDDEDRDMALHMYANPVLHKLYFVDATKHPLPEGLGELAGSD